MGRKLMPPIFNPVDKWPVIFTKNGCIEYEFKRYDPKDGYITIYFNRMSQSAHKAVWIYNNGEVPNGLIVKHSCDNRRCINIEHLSIGTQKENINEAVVRGGIPIGGSHWRAKKVIDTSTGQIFGTVAEAATSCNMKSPNLIAILQGRKTNDTKFKYYEGT